MSYTIRDDNPIFGSGAAVEHSQGYGASVIGCIQSYEPTSLNGATAATFVNGSFNTIFIAPPSASLANGTLPLGQKYQVVGVTYRYGTAGGAGSVFTVEIVPAGTADGSGNNVLNATNVSLATAASNTPTNLALNTNVDNLIVLPGGRINVNASGAATTGLANFTVMVYLARTA
jgi:hypothetical protein